MDSDDFRILDPKDSKKLIKTQSASIFGDQLVEDLIDIFNRHGFAELRKTLTIVFGFHHTDSTLIGTIIAQLAEKTA